ncbi:MAG TPA: tRNA 2-selenouridine(34) synthase MnmH [Chitinophagaceae bacterium]|nr:tRNA 2-selenouridine(34) synthase MnmH [Chitinophagaceae bacterium]
MAIEKINIEKFLELSQKHVVIDVRSPAEYKHAHIPGAYNLPLFSDEERKIVGTAYKQQSREAAIKIGLDFFGPKMKKMVEEVEKIIDNRQQAIDNRDYQHKNDHLPIANCLLIHCWRGGMRSAGVAWLMDLYGFKVYTLERGYKRFRNYVLDSFKLPFQFNILGGYTGSGKTEVLKTLKQHGETVIDLEKLAKHKGSAFGKIGEKQPSQEMFENILSFELRAMSFEREADFSKETSNSIWIEDESQRIGDLNIPHELWKTMRRSVVYFLDIPFEKRLDHIVKEYGSLDKKKLVNSILRIQKRLGGLEAKNAINFLLENNTTECFRILLKYYDKWYLKSLHNRENVNSLLINIPCESVGPQNAKVLRQQAIIS